jgi:hypothetical protein
VALSVEACEVPSPHKLIGRYMMIIVHHSSDFRVPVSGSLKLYGIDQTYDGVAMSLMISWIRSMTAGVVTFTVGDIVNILGFDSH